MALMVVQVALGVKAVRVRQATQELQETMAQAVQADHQAIQEIRELLAQMV